MEYKINKLLDTKELIRIETTKIIPQLDLSNFSNKLYEAGGIKESIQPIIAIYLIKQIISKLSYSNQPQYSEIKTLINFEVFIIKKSDLTAS